MSDRYVVRKESGSDIARVWDTKKDRVVARFNIFASGGKGWEAAKRRCASMNKANNAKDSA